MIVVDQVPWVVLLMIGGMLMLGTWPAVWNKVRAGSSVLSRFLLYPIQALQTAASYQAQLTNHAPCCCCHHQVELSGRLPAHTFLDYTVAYLVVAVVTSLTFGQLGPSYHDLPNFLEQLQQPNGPVVAFAIAGGICLSLGDIAMQYAVAFLGLSIGPPILNALTIIIGIILSYFLDGGINQAHLVFTGMACAAIAIALGTAAHLTHPATKQQLATAAAKRRQKKAAAAAAAGGCEPDQEDPSTTSAASADCTAVLPPPSADQDTVSSRDCTVTIPPAAVQQQPGAPVSSSSSMSGAGAAAAAPVAAAAAPAVAVLVPSHPAGAAAVLVGVGGCEGPSELQEELIKEPAPERSVDTSNMSVYLGLAIAIVGEWERQSRQQRAAGARQPGAEAVQKMAAFAAADLLVVTCRTPWMVVF
jgi:hypothetical protein